MTTNNLLVTTSFHKLSHLYGNKKDYSYVFLGTIFDRLSGGYNPGYGEHSVRAAIANGNIPLIARGGITQELLPKCHDLGFAGVALASCIWEKPKAVDAWCEILKSCKEHDIPTT